MLRDCQVLEGDKNIVVEHVRTHAEVVLPKQHHGILKLLDGKNSIQDISSQLYKSQGQVSFNSIIRTIKLLQELNLLEGVDGEFDDVQDDKCPHDQKPSILNRPVFELKLLGKVTSRWPTNDLVFYGLSACLTLLMVFGYTAFKGVDFSQFLKSSNGYEEAFPRLFLISSLLMSIKGMLQGILLLTSVGTFYRPTLRLLPYALVFGVNDSSIYSHLRKKVIITYAALSGFLYLISFSALAWLPPFKNYSSDLAVLAILLTFIDLNPYRRSDLTKIFNFFYAEAQLKNVMPYLKNCTLTGLWKETGAKASDEIRYVIYSVLSLSWAITFALFSFEVTLQAFPHLFFQVQLGQFNSSASAAGIILLLSFLTGYLLIDLTKTIIQNVFSPLLSQMMKVQSKAQTKTYTKDDLSFDLIKENFKLNMFFNHLSESAIDYLIKNSVVKEIKKGSHLIVQGDNNQDVFFLIRGRVEVNVREKTGRVKHVATLGPQAVIGEKSILEDCDRTANVVATEDLVYLELPEKIFSQLFEQKQYSADYEKLINRIQISQFVSSANLFKDFPPEIINMFVESGDLVLFPAGHNVVDEGEQDKTFYLLVKGSVEVHKQGKKVSQLQQGDFFGEIALIANVPRTATVKTVEDSLFLCIEAKDFWNILSENIELAMYLESVGQVRMADAA